MFGRSTRLWAAAAVACTTVGLRAQNDPVVIITLERTPCFGACPSYTLRITGDGHVDYEGRQHVRVTGKASGSIPPEAVLTLVDEAGRIGYFDFRDRYTAAITDLPTTTTSFRIGSRYKQVVDYFGAPDALLALERRIDEVANSIHWVSVDADTVRELQRDGWTASGDDGERYLREAVRRADENTVAALLKAGADPNRDTPSVLTAARKASIVKLLVEAGADVNFADASGRTPLLYAARYLEPDILGALLDADADIGVAGPAGETVLMAAAASGRAENVRLILRAGARVGATDAAGRTALDLAVQRKSEPAPAPGTPREFDEIIAMLRAAGAR